MPEFSDIQIVLCRERLVKKRVIARDRSWGRYICLSRAVPTSRLLGAVSETTKSGACRFRIPSRPPYEGRLQEMEKQFGLDRRGGLRGAALSGALSIKYPMADVELAWQDVFPAHRVYTEERTGARRRHHYHESALQRAFGDSSPPGTNNKARELPLAEAFLRHAFVGGRNRHPNNPGATCWAHGLAHDDDLHPCLEPRCNGRKKSGGPPLRQ